MCFRANEDYISTTSGFTDRTSRLGNNKCFEPDADTDTQNPGSMARCVEEFQEANQQVYVIFILVLCPLQVIAAYVGWVLPDLYFQAHHQAKEDAALRQHATSFESENPAAQGDAVDK